MTVEPKCCNTEKECCEKSKKCCMEFWQEVFLEMISNKDVLTDNDFIRAISVSDAVLKAVKERFCDG